MSKKIVGVAVIICDGHQYRVRDERVRYVARNNYGTDVAVAFQDATGEYWYFETIPEGKGDQYHENALGDTYTIQEQLVRWYAAVEA